MSLGQPSTIENCSGEHCIIVSHNQNPFQTLVASAPMVSQEEYLSWNIDQSGRAGHSDVLSTRCADVEAQTVDECQVSSVLRKLMMRHFQKGCLNFEHKLSKRTSFIIHKLGLKLA